MGNWESESWAASREPVARTLWSGDRRVVGGGCRAPGAVTGLHHVTVSPSPGLARRRAHGRERWGRRGPRAQAGRSPGAHSRGLTLKGPPPTPLRASLLPGEEQGPQGRDPLDDRAGPVGGRRGPAALCWRHEALPAGPGAVGDSTAGDLRLREVCSTLSSKADGVYFFFKPIFG